MKWVVKHTASPRRCFMILVTGGTGFVGRHLIQRMRKEGIAIRAVVKTVDKAQSLEALGVNLIQGDITDKASLEKAIIGVTRVIHLVGIIQETPHVTFQGVHVEGTRNILDAAKRAAVHHFFYQSALGTRPAAKSTYHKSKWEAEELVRSSGIPYTIMRPSLIYGSGDGFTTRLSVMIKLSPFLPVIGSGKSKVQPIFINDVISCILKAMTNNSFLNEIYEIGGPEQLTYEEVTLTLAKALGVRRPTMHLPLFSMKLIARILEALLSVPPLTTDQLTMLQEDNICSMQDINDAFGIEPVKFHDGLASFIATK
jgi:uncharacterized protein YbjT (DUF2867 family)